MAVEKRNDGIDFTRDWYNWDIIMSSWRTNISKLPRGSLAYFACSTTLTEKNVFINHVHMLFYLLLALRVGIMNITVQLTRSLQPENEAIRKPLLKCA